MLAGIKGYYTIGLLGFQELITEYEGRFTMKKENQTNDIIKEQENISRSYPTVFIHGLGGWGEEDGMETKLRYRYWGFSSGERDLLAHLKNEGYEVFNPSLGPFTSAWDRACELWAYLFGGKVDFGKYHSETYGHLRYGRTYPGVLKDLGRPGPHEMINLIGHSFGGPTAILFVDLLWNGSEKERACTPEDQLSPLFVGGKAFINCLITLSGANNGTTFADFFGEKGIKALAGVIYTANALAAPTPLMRLLDFHTDQWGIMSRSKYYPYGMPSLKNRLNGVQRLLNQRLDNVGYELQVEYAAEINKGLRPCPSTYYYAFRCCRTHSDGNGHQVPDRDMRRILKLWSTVIGRYQPNKLAPYGFDESWLPSDGIVNVKCLGAPFSLPCLKYDPAVPTKPGVWYEMPVEDKHHMSWVGIGEDEKALFSFFDDLYDSFLNNK